MRNFILFLLLAFGFSVSEIQAQERRATIIDDLETFVAGEGIIHISSDPKITELIGKPSLEAGTGDRYFVKANGFRVQVFMSNDARTARKEVSDKGILLKGKFPEIAVYPEYAAPNWKLLAGDFTTKEEAEIFKQKLQKEIPALGKEMYIVQAKINISMQKFD